MHTLPGMGPRPLILPHKAAAARLQHELDLTDDYRDRMDTDALYALVCRLEITRIKLMAELTRRHGADTL